MAGDVKPGPRPPTERELEVIAIGEELAWGRGWQNEAARRLGVSKQMIHSVVKRLRAKLVTPGEGSSSGPS